MCHIDVQRAKRAKDVSGVCLPERGEERAMKSAHCQVARQLQLVHGGPQRSHELQLTSICDAKEEGETELT